MGMLSKFNGSCEAWFDEHTNRKSQVNFWKDVEYRMTDIMRVLTENPINSKMTEWITMAENWVMRESSVTCLFAFHEARSLADKKVQQQHLLTVQLAKVKTSETRQINACKRQIEAVLKSYQIDDGKTRSDFIKKIRIDGNKDDVSDAEITAFRGAACIIRIVFERLEQSMPVSATLSSTTTRNLTSNC
ncbi:8181_t:CDS:2 [Paraglomus occultum]|uniref:8181_t:CDS:1 n=1 Tax=Paraglomus occultum TaxID=144539 RepID=A0A9N9BNM1_9GLOM|nr:8181_t:CDS:2 [Paraglomus occultum]